MDTLNEQRSERRLYYNWPLRFARQLGENLCEGQMLDVSSKGGAFIYKADENCPYPDQQITALFGVPRFESEMENFIRKCRVCRVDNISRFMRRVAVEFLEPLSFEPAKESFKLDSHKKPEAVKI